MAAGRASTFLNIMRVMAAKLLGMVMSFAISVGIANFFGATSTTDAYFFARRIITNLGMMLERAFALLLVPPLVQMAQQQGLQALRGYLDRRNLQILLASLAVVVPAFVFAPQIIRFLAPGFDEDTLALAVPFFRILVVTLPISAITALSGALLNALRIFSMPTLARLLPRVFVILALILVPAVGFGMGAVATAFTAGTVAMGLVFVVLVRRAFATTEDEVTDAKSSGGTKFTKLRILAMLIAQVHLVGSSWIDMAFATTTAAGSVAMLEFGQRLVNMAPGVMTSGVVVVYYTEFARSMAAGDIAGFRINLRDCMRFTLFLTMPVAAILLVLNQPLVDIVLNHGAFTPEAAGTTAAIVAILACLLPVNTLLGSMTSAIFANAALPHVRIIVISITIALAVRIGIDFWLIDSLGVLAIPIGSLVAMTVLLLLLYGFLTSRMGAPVHLRELGPFAGIILSSAALMAVVWGVFTGLGAGPDSSRAALVGIIALACLLGGTVYLITARLLKLPEAEQSLAYLAKIRRKVGL